MSFAYENTLRGIGSILNLIPARRRRLSRKIRVISSSDEITHRAWAKIGEDIQKIIDSQDIIIDDNGNLIIEDDNALSPPTVKKVKTIRYGKKKIQKS